MRSMDSMKSPQVLAVFCGALAYFPGLRFWHEAAEQHGAQRAKAQAGEVGSRWSGGFTWFLHQFGESLPSGKTMVVNR